MICTALTDYARHYDDFVDCDFCGQATRGRVYPQTPTAVHCGSCGRIIVNYPSGSDTVNPSCKTSSSRMRR